MAKLEAKPTTLSERVWECVRMLEGLVKDADGLPTQQIWDQILAFQTHFYLPEDLRFLFNLPAFRRAERVLDVGCGQGDFLDKVAQFFPAKHYTGLDVAEDHLEVARSKNQRPHVRFVCADARTFTDGTYDVILCKLVLQHIQEAREFVRHLMTRLAPGGVVIVMDADDNSRLFHPEMPELDIFYREMRAHQGQGNGVRHESARLEAAASEENWYVVRSDRAPSPICRERDRIRFAQFFTYIGLMVSRRGLAVNLGKLLFDLAAWAMRDHAYAQITLHRLALAHDRRKVNR